MGKILGWVGGVATALWVGLLATYVIFKWEKIVNLEPNALGDLLGGSMGPLALFWLVLGYLQQGIELRQNGAALNLQAEELKNAVDQYKEMARVANEQLIHEKESAIRAAKSDLEKQKRQKAAIQPNFILSQSGGSHSQVSTHNFMIRNAGASANDVTLQFNDATSLSQPKIAHWGNGKSHEMIFNTPHSAQIEEKELTITYHDADGDISSVIFVAEFFNHQQTYSTPVFRKKILKN